MEKIQGSLNNTKTSFQRINEDNKLRPNTTTLFTREIKDPSFGAQLIKNGRVEMFQRNIGVIIYYLKKPQNKLHRVYN